MALGRREKNDKNNFVVLHEMGRHGTVVEEWQQNAGCIFGMYFVVYRLFFVIMLLSYGSPVSWLHFTRFMWAWLVY